MGAAENIKEEKTTERKQDGFPAGERKDCFSSKTAGLGSATGNAAARRTESGNLPLEKRSERSDALVLFSSGKIGGTNLWKM